jgi:flagellar basal-body rod protein FlgC
MFRTIDISTSGLVAQRHRLDTIAGNIANINTTRNARGQAEPYQRRFIEFMKAQESRDADQQGMGVKFNVRIDRNSPPRKLYQPGHPDADATGMVSYPNIDLTTEFVNALEASRAYEANIAAVEIAKSMLLQSLRILS